MHSITPYTLSSYHKDFVDESGSHYPPLDQIGSHDTFDIFRTYIESQEGKQKDEDSKSFYGFRDITCNKEERVITGWLETGHYGYGASIVNIESDEEEFKRGVNNAELIRHFFHIYLPEGMKNGILLVHNFKSSRIKTLISKSLGGEFRRVTSRVLKIEPLTIAEAYQEWMEGVTKELKLISYKPQPDLIDILNDLGAKEQEMSVKAPRNKSFGKLADFFKPNSEQVTLVKQLSHHCTAVKAKVKFGDRTRTFKVGVDSSSSSTMSDFEFDTSEVDFDEDQQPKLNSIRYWTAELCLSISKKIHGDKEKVEAA